MKKDLQKKGDGLMIYYTKKECKHNNYEAGDLLNLSDSVLIKHQEASENVSDIMAKDRQPETVSKIQEVINDDKGFVE